MTYNVFGGTLNLAQLNPGCSLTLFCYFVSVTIQCASAYKIYLCTAQLTGDKYTTKPLSDAARGMHMTLLYCPFISKL